MVYTSISLLNSPLAYIQYPVSTPSARLYASHVQDGRRQNEARRRRGRGDLAIGRREDFIDLCWRWVQKSEQSDVVV